MYEGREIKIVFTGPMGAGKTTAIAALSDSAPVATEVHNADRASADKETTTVALDFGQKLIAAAVHRFHVDRRIAVEPLEAVARQHLPERRRDGDPSLPVDPVGDARYEAVHRSPQPAASGA